ncbi:MAG: ribbon-helix-helix domain-containing protein [Sulfolobales archaeon]
MVVILRIVTFKIDEVLLEEVDRVAKTFGISRSEIIRDALSSYLRSIRVVRKNNINIKKVTLA